MADDSALVNLNVGGKHFTTLLGTLRSHKGSSLCQMFSPPFAGVLRDKEGGFFIDRNGEVFGLLLDYLRTGTLVVPRDPVQYTMLRREATFYGLPVAFQLPQVRPITWEAAPARYRHARIVIDEIDKLVEWEEGPLPPDIFKRSTSEIVAFFSSKGYKIVSEFTSRGTKGLSSIWMRRKEPYPGADVALEIASAPLQPQSHQQQILSQPRRY